MSDQSEQLAKKLYAAWSSWRVRETNVMSPRFEFTDRAVLAPFRELAAQLVEGSR
jgi:hypothetical protein